MCRFTEGSQSIRSCPSRHHRLGDDSPVGEKSNPLSALTYTFIVSLMFECHPTFRERVGRVALEHYGGEERTPDLLG
jgi:hypothetical protein